MAPGLSGGVGGEVPQSHGVQRPATQREVLPHVPGGHAEGGAGRHGGAAVGEAPRARRQDQGQRVGGQRAEVTGGGHGPPVAFLTPGLTLRRQCVLLSGIP